MKTTKLSFILISKIEQIVMRIGIITSQRCAAVSAFCWSTQGWLFPCKLI